MSNFSLSQIILGAETFARTKIREWAQIESFVSFTFANEQNSLIFLSFFWKETVGSRKITVADPESMQTSRRRAIREEMLPQFLKLSYGGVIKLGQWEINAFYTNSILRP